VVVLPIKAKAGDTFTYLITWDIATAVNELKSEVRNGKNELLSTATIELFEAPNTFEVTIKDTGNWPSVVYTDVQHTAEDGTVSSSETMQIMVERRITQ
jgi:anti-sigma regulatory factor (Ser/Thr protein kinase)